MQEAVPVGEGSMAAVIGLDDAAVVAACADEVTAAGEPVVAANFNAPGQVVIAGRTGAVERAGARCRERGARRVLPLPVSAPFHSPLMAPARAGLEPTLRALALADLTVPLYRNVDAEPITGAEALREGLIRQVDAAVLWSQTIRRMREDGFDTFVEIGTGFVLGGLVRRVQRDAVCYAAGTEDGIRETLARLT
jgi:[acyl-carrier-protein] S-malonyltransferase